MAEEERETVWLVVVDGEGVGETRLCLGDDKLIETVYEFCEGEDWRKQPEVYDWREFIMEIDNWMTIDRSRDDRRWRLVTDIGETGHLMIQQVDRQDMMELV